MENRRAGCPPAGGPQGGAGCRQEARWVPRSGQLPGGVHTARAVGDCGGSSSSPLCTLMACGLAGMRGGVSVHQLGPRWGVPRGRRARGTEGHSVSFHLGPGAGLVAPGTPRCPGPLSRGSPSVVQDGARASWPAGRRAVCILPGVRVWPLLSLLVRSLLICCAAQLAGSQLPGPGTGTGAMAVKAPNQPRGHQETPG